MTAFHFGPKWFTAMFFIGVVLTGPAVPAAETIEEVIVTAQKRSESLSDVPISITAMTGSDIQELELKTADELVAFVPNLQMQSNQGSTGGKYYLRGIGDGITTANGVAGVGIFVDEVYLNSNVVNMFTLFDLERVEVLRGPQNTLYGRNTTGGAINFVTRRPDIADGTNGHAEFGVGNIGRFDFDGAIGFAVGDNVAARIAVNSQNRDGLYDNPTTGNEESDIERHVIRAQLLVNATADLDLLFNVHGGTNRGENRRYKSIGTIDPAALSPPVNSVYGFAQDVSCTSGFQLGNGCVDIGGFRDNDDLRDNFSDEPTPHEDLDAYGGAITLNWRLPHFDLTSITSFDSFDFAMTEDTDGGPNPLFVFLQTSEADQISQEIRLTSNTEGPLQWIAGAYFFNEDLRQTATALTRATLNFGPSEFGRGSSADFETDNLAAFGEIAYAITDIVKLTVGLRYTSETKDGDTLGYIFDPAIVPRGATFDLNRALANTFAPPVVSGFDETWKEPGGRIVLDFQVTDAALLYGSISRGFKGGNFNASTAAALNGFAGLVVDPEFITTYEIGAKTRWMDGRLVLNGALFYNDYTDQQVNRLEAGVTILTNAAESSIVGGELELQWVPADGWFIRASLGLLDGKFDSYTSGGSDFSDTQLINAPDWNLSVVARKEWQLTDGLFSLQADVAAVDDQYFDAGESPLMLEDGYAVWNARAAYTFGPNGRYSIAAWGKNLSEEAYCETRSDISVFGFVGCLPTEPRTFGITGMIEF